MPKKKKRQMDVKMYGHEMPKKKKGLMDVTKMARKLQMIA